MHFLTLAINHSNFLYTVEQSSRVCSFPISPRNGSTHLFHCLEVLITHICFFPTRAVQKLTFSASSFLAFGNIFRSPADLENLTGALSVKGRKDAAAVTDKPTAFRTGALLQSTGKYPVFSTKLVVLTCSCDLASNTA